MSQISSLDHHPSPAHAPAGERLSIIVPVYNEARNLPNLHAALVEVAARLQAQRGLAVEIIYVDDGSRDASYEVARRLEPSGVSLQVLSLSRNFGKEAALMAGIEHAGPGAMLFMDGDGQHPPAMVETLVGHWLDDGFDVVYTAKSHRADEPMPKRLLARAFYRTINWGLRYKIPENSNDFRLLSPRAAQAFRRLPERNRFFKGLSGWIGFRQKRVEFEPAERAHGASSWNFFSLLALSIEGVTSFSLAPLRMATGLGFLLAGSAFLYGLWIIIDKVLFGIDVPGYPSLMVGVMVIGGVQLLMIGVLGEYIGRILSELKARPIYFIAEHEAKPAEPLPQSKAAE